MWWVIINFATKKNKKQKKMKTYILTDRDINNLKLFFGNNTSALNYLQDWQQKLKELPTPKKKESKFCITEDFNKFIEDSDFAKPSQPYYVKDGHIYTKEDLDLLFKFR